MDAEPIVPRGGFSRRGVMQTTAALASFHATGVNASGPPPINDPATGVRIRDYPLTLDKVLKGMRAA